MKNDLRSILILLLLATPVIGCSSSGSSAGPGDSGGISDGGSLEGGAVVTVASGQVRGHSDGQVLAFLGIPYAKPPVDSLRWKAPEKPDAWGGVLDAAHFGKRCAQNANSTLMTAASTDEDCLYLNVWTPSPAASKLPVMVWFHGGGNTGGSASDPVPFADGGYFYSGAPLAGNGAVVVSLNYRLGVFGFFAHPGLAAEGSKAGNQGLWDQRLALQWVQDNIAKFGGDPGNVTIFGESAGSFDVCMHVASPQTPALFEHAVSESGGCTTRQTALADSQALMVDFASGVGCGAGDGGAGSLACLRALPVAALLAGALPDAGMAGSLGPFGPVVDDDFLSDQPRTLYKGGKIAKVPYLLGSNNDEGTLFEIGVAPVTDQPGLTAFIDGRYGDAGAAVAALYPPAEFDGGNPNPFQAAVTRIVGDSLLVCSTYDSALLAAAQGSNVYMYNFDVPVVIPGVVGPTPSELFLGASHGSELSFVFGTSPQFSTDMAQAGLSALMERYWTRFAKAGDPNGGMDLAWPKFSAQNDQRMQFALPTPTILDSFRSAECGFWISQYEAQFTP